MRRAKIARNTCCKFICISVLLAIFIGRKPASEMQRSVIELHGSLAHYSLSYCLLIFLKYRANITDVVATAIRSATGSAINTAMVLSAVKIAGMI